jgi:hypothetical protein
LSPKCSNVAKEEKGKKKKERGIKMKQEGHIKRE